LRFAGAGHEVIRGKGHAPIGGRDFEPDSVLGCAPDRDWNVLHHAQIKDPGLGVRALLERWGEGRGAE